MKPIFESLIVFGIMTGLLLPTRILFVEYVSDEWFGSLGIITAVSVSIIILAKTKKLGSFGTMFERQMYKFQKGKRSIIIIAESVFFIIALGGVVFAIEQGNSTYSDLKPQNIGNLPENPTPEKIFALIKDLSPYEVLVGFLLTPIVFVTEFPYISAFFASVDEKMDGWLLHFYTVGFVEYIEILGILVFYKVSFQIKKHSNQYHSE